MSGDHSSRILEFARAAVVPQQIPRAETRQIQPVAVREVLAVSALVVLTDATIFRGHGYGGLALLCLLSPVLFVLGRLKPAFSWDTAVTGIMLCLLAARTAWLGSPLGVVVGIVLLFAASMALDGQRPFLLALLVYAAQRVATSAAGWNEYLVAAQRLSPRVPRLAWLNLLLPLAALVLFGSFFVLANPDLVTALSNGGDYVFRWLEAWAGRVNVSGFEIAFCATAALVSIALLRPLGKTASSDDAEQMATKSAESVAQESPLFGAIQNTLIAVIVLFAVYFVFEFRTLWFREFPKGFYYAGYAHRGAAWLTAALALATVVLSAIFQGSLLQDPRLPRLKWLAWIWSIENLILAATVYNRMHIYIDFNGLTRMRMIGLFGITSVLVGFCLVLWKINYRRDFTWLVQRQLWTVAIAAYLFALTPVDWLIHSYNVRQIMSGDLAPAVQITEHPVNTEGILALEPLIDCEDSIIRAGILALLAERATAGETLAKSRAQQGWTTYQQADRLLLDRLRARQADWEPYLDDEKRAEAWQRFRDYAYQWY
jgi:hypothetical protein